jgi:subtilase family serine protease
MKKLGAVALAATTMFAFTSTTAEAGQASMVDNCVAQINGKTVPLGCSSFQLSAEPGSLRPMLTDTPQGYSPQDLAKAYHLPDFSVGAKKNIAVISVGAYPTLENDLGVYRKQFGLSSCTTANGCLKIVDYHGDKALESNQFLQFVEEPYALETALDVEMAAASCPTCSITVVQIPMDLKKMLEAALVGKSGELADDFGTAVETGVKLGASAVSMSYGLPTGMDAEYLATGKPAQQLKKPGVAIVAASGDGGYQSGAQMWPQELPWVVSVGGTTMNRDTYAQTAWGGDYASKQTGKTQWVGPGSGCAMNLPPAEGQPKTISDLCKGHRASTDISAVADPHTGVSIYDSYYPWSGRDGAQMQSWHVAGGTSAATPIIAGLYARGGHTDDVLGPNTLYTAKPGTFANITTGSNAKSGCPDVAPAICTAGPGWNGPTGLGVPQGLL